MAKLCLITINAAGVNTGRFSPQDSASLGEALDFLQWKSVSVVAELGKEREFLARFLKYLDVKTTSSFSKLSTKTADRTVLISPDCDQDSIDLIAESLLLHRPDTFFVLAPCSEGELEKRLDDILTPTSFFVAAKSSLEAGGIHRFMTMRERNTTRSCFIPFREPTGAKDKERRRQCKFGAMGSDVAATTLEFEPYILLHNCSGPSRDKESQCQITGMVKELFQLLAKVCNFTYTLSVDPTGIWGDNSTGVIGRTLSGKIDLPLSVWSVKVDWKSVADMTLAFTHSSFFCYQDQKNVLHEDALFLAHPLSAESWLALLVLALVAMAVLLALAAIGNGTTTKRLIYLFSGIVFTVVYSMLGGHRCSS